MIKIAKNQDDYAKCWPTMHELRTDISYVDYLEMLENMEAEGYIMAYIENEGVVACVAGFRINTVLYRGRFLYVDDLVTARNFRSLKLGAKMMDWLKAYAKENGCNNLSLHSGGQRSSAHKFYFNQGFSLLPHRFNIEL